MMIRQRITLLLVAPLLIGAALLPARAAAQGPAVDVVLSGFEPVTYLLEVDGKAAPKAEVYQSRRAGAFLVIAPELPAPVLLQMRTAEVETVDLMKVHKKADGTVDLFPESTLAAQGRFEVSSGDPSVSFAVDGRRVVLKEKPPLLGAQDLDGMRGYSIDYQRAAAAYTPSAPILDRLRSQSGAVRVDVYFGTWCPFCQQMVPRMMRVHQELGNSPIEIRYYGLPRNIDTDAKASALDIHGVPTGVVFVQDREVGRISGNGWKVPELALNNILLAARRATSG